MKANGENPEEIKSKIEELRKKLTLENIGGSKPTQGHEQLFEK